ncbi:hypothetical protein Hanom_Chr08g00706571 [Helianthus anomalus]
MHPFNRSFVPLRSSADTNQTSNPSHPVYPVPTRPTPTDPVLLSTINIKPGL